MPGRLNEGITSALEARTNNHKNQLEGRKGHAVLKQTQAKHDTYAPLIAVAEKQFQTKRRMQKPIFWAAVASTYGELGPETIKLQEWLTSTYGRKLAREGPRPDGMKNVKLTAAYRNDFRERIIMAVAKGQSKMLTTCGLPAITCRKHVVMIPGVLF